MPNFNFSSTFGDRPADRDPDRLARFGHVRHEPTVRGGLARRLNLARIRRPGKSGVRGRGNAGTGTTVFGAASRRAQRVVIKVLSRRHWPNKGSGLRRHVTYLARDSASRDGKQGVFYSTEKDVLTASDAGAIARQWEHDRHHFRIVISAEKAEQIHDLRAYVRNVVRRMEGDLQTKLQWIAIDHHNTDNPHSHVLVRGIDERQQVLTIRGDYIAHGMRQRAAQVATELLGERTAQEIRAAKVAEVQAERFTSLDRHIERGLNSNRFDAARRLRVGFAREDRNLVIGRLQFLEALGLASKGRGTTWQVDPEFRRRLMELGARNDIIRQLYSALGSAAGQARTVNRRSLSGKPVTGTLLAKGSVDEISDLRFVAVRDDSGSVHYARVRDGRSYCDIEVGDRVELGRAAYEQRRAVEAVKAIAAANGGVYRADNHREQLRTMQPLWSDEARCSLVGAHVRKLARWAERETTGITRINDTEYQIDLKKFDRYLNSTDGSGVVDIGLSGARGRRTDRSRDASGREVD